MHTLKATVRNIVASQLSMPTVVLFQKIPAAKANALNAQFASVFTREDTSVIPNRDVYRIFIIGFPTSGVGRYFNRGGEATSDAQLNPGNSISVCIAHIHEGSCKHTIPYTK